MKVVKNVKVITSSNRNLYHGVSFSGLVKYLAPLCRMTYSIQNTAFWMALIGSSSILSDRSAIASLYLEHTETFLFKVNNLGIQLTEDLLPLRELSSSKSDCSNLQNSEIDQFLAEQFSLRYSADQI